MSAGMQMQSAAAIHPQQHHVTSDSMECGASSASRSSNSSPLTSPPPPLSAVPSSSNSSSARSSPNKSPSPPLGVFSNKANLSRGVSVPMPILSSDGGTQPPPSSQAAQSSLHHGSYAPGSTSVMTSMNWNYVPTNNPLSGSNSTYVTSSNVPSNSNSNSSHVSMSTTSTTTNTTTNGNKITTSSSNGTQNGGGGVNLIVHKGNPSKAPIKTTNTNAPPMAQIATTGGIRHNLPINIPRNSALGAPNTNTNTNTSVTSANSNHGNGTSMTTSTSTTSNPPIQMSSIHSSMPNFAFASNTTQTTHNGNGSDNRNNNNNSNSPHHHPPEFSQSLGPKPKSPRLGSLGSNPSNTKLSNSRRSYSFSGSDTSAVNGSSSSTHSDTLPHNHSNNHNHSNIHTNTHNHTNNNNSNTNSSLNQRRQKRLERNRESARLSRRRRKQYLEVLEERVTFLSEEMDRGRREHVLAAVSTYRNMRRDCLKEVLLQSPSRSSSMTGNAGNYEYEQQVKTLNTHLSRTSKELNIATTFGREYLKSLILPPTSKFVLWLTLQNDVYYRGGRAASERLSAARIGERMLSCGNDRVNPANGMWPLFCNEIGLSYDQEERVRNYQRGLIAKHESWLHRHTGASSEHVIRSTHDAICSIGNMTRTREQKVLDVLTTDQRAKFLAWVGTKKEPEVISRLARVLSSSLSLGTSTSSSLNLVKGEKEGLSGSGGNGSTTASDHSKLNHSGNSNSTKNDKDAPLETSTERHDAANLYIINDKLSTVSKSLPPAVPFVTAPSSLRRLARRPSFESLAAANEESASTTGGGGGSSSSSSKGGNGGGGGSKKLSKDNSHPSSGSLKRCSSEISCDGMMMDSSSNHHLTTVPSITPEAAQNAASHSIAAALGPVRHIIPPLKTWEHAKQPLMTQPPHAQANTPIVTTTCAVMTVKQPPHQPMTAYPIVSQQQQPPTTVTPLVQHHSHNAPPPPNPYSQQPQPQHQHKTAFQMQTQQPHPTFVPYNPAGTASYTPQHHGHGGNVPILSAYSHSHPGAAAASAGVVPTPIPSNPSVSVPTESSPTSTSQQQGQPSMSVSTPHPYHSTLQQQQQPTNTTSTTTTTPNSTTVNFPSTLPIPVVPVTVPAPIAPAPSPLAPAPAPIPVSTNTPTSTYTAVPSPLYFSDSQPPPPQFQQQQQSQQQQPQPHSQQMQEQTKVSPSSSQQDHLYQQGQSDADNLPSILSGQSMNIVPEEGYLSNMTGQEGDDFLLDLAEGDWAIGEGFEMDIS